jgi:hypothetical protein
MLLLIVRKLRVQLLLVGVLCLVQGLAALGAIPPSEHLSQRLIHLLEQGGFWLVALFSFVENLPGLNVYFPGSVVLITRMSLTAGYPGVALLTYLAIVLPAIAANMVSYWIGRRLAPNSAVAAPAEKKLWWWYLSTYWHPQLAAMTALASGSSGIPFIRYAQHFLPISIALSFIWGLALYSLGSVGPIRESVFPLAWVYVLVWIAWDVYKFVRENRRGHVDRR